ncbi:NAD-dependent epimerase/dehydratase family protein [Methyloglobulus sp.]|uniref:NAD-dependent epimerase/dehydratase family protein n=1 Tax=Methyloglobulus sp. TaxID=2518622 RepID=UPI0032B709A6
MSEKRWKVGLLGAGYIIEAHAKSLNYQNNVEIAAVCDQSKDRAEKAAATFGISAVFTSLDAMLKSDIEVVHVLLPPDLHFDTARQIIESGRHVFLEKPMGLNAAECQSLTDLATTRGVKLGVNHNFLFLPSYQKLRQDVRDGTIGKLDHITINWMFPLPQIQFGPFNIWMLQKPANLFFELGPHLVAFLEDLLGQPDRIQVDVSLPIDLPGDNRIYRRWHVHGSKGDVIFNLNLSVIPGYTDRSISVRGHAATATCLFDRDIYYRDEPSGAGILFDNFLTAKNIAWQVGVNSLSNLTRATKATLQKAPAANPFGESIENSVKCFYDTLTGQSDARMDGQFGVNVISTCEQITKKASFEKITQKGVWNVLPPLRPPTVLVLGGTGFIGQYLVKALIKRGLGVRVVTRGMGAGQIALADLPVELVQGELANPDFMDKALQGIEVVYHLAKTDGKKWDDYYKNDVLVTQNIANRALAKGVKRFIYTGTIDSYYSAGPNDVITSDTPLDPNIATRNHYARSKAACEDLLMKLHKENNLPLVIFRPGIVIGKGCPPAHWGVGMFQSDTRMQFWGDGSTKLPLVLVEDVAEALALGIDKKGIEGQAFLLTDAPLLTGKEYVEIVSQETGTKIRSVPTPTWKFFVIDALKETAKHLIRHPNRKTLSFRDWDSRSHRARYDSSKTVKVLGWQPAATRESLIRRGITETIREFYR